jgi:hypothetical protein
LLGASNPVFAMQPRTDPSEHDAAQAGDLQFVAMRLGDHAKHGSLDSVINGFDTLGHTLLTRALMGKSGKTNKTDNRMIELLLQCKADPNQTTKAGESPLKIATDSGDFGVVNFLLNQGATCPADVAPGLLASIQSFVSAVQNQNFLITSQREDIVKLDQELALYHERCECGGSLSSDSEIFSEQGKPEEEEEEEEEEEGQEGPVRLESPENPEIGPSQSPPSPRFAPHNVPPSLPAIALAAAPALQDEPARSKSPTNPAASLEEHDWELVEEQEGA